MDTSLPFLLSLAGFSVTLLCHLVFSPLLWSRIREYRTLPESKKLYLITLLASTVQAIFASIVTGFIITTGWLGDVRVYSKSQLGFTTMQVSFGYFVADLLFCLYFPRLRNEFVVSMIFHHTTSIIGIGLGLYYQGKLMYFVVCQFISECSTPFTNLHRVLNDLKRRSGFWYWFAFYGKVIAFFLCRILFIPWHWYELLLSLADPPSSLHLRVWTCVICAAFDVLNVYWFCRMIRRLLMNCWNGKTKKATVDETTLTPQLEVAFKNSESEYGKDVLNNVNKKKGCNTPVWNESLVTQHEFLHEVSSRK